jgi:hypothetical protein
MTTLIRQIASSFILAAGLALSTCVFFASLSVAGDFDPGGRYDGISEGMSPYGSSRYGDEYQRRYGLHPNQTHDGYGYAKPYDQQLRELQPTKPSADPDPHGFGYGVMKDGKLTICRDGGRYNNTVSCR